MFHSVHSRISVPMQSMRNVTQVVPREPYRTQREEVLSQCELVVNYCHAVVRPDEEHLRLAMLEYEQSLRGAPEPALRPKPVKGVAAGFEVQSKSA